ncbi:17157_t:CDS:2 [Acaulospora morrowiae]|uniref:17157_t:CDS:1 n=1 Tax=Acaulospora morrowiae TaxID=94023 RepID=A0A9N8YR73_9GLOM|nr:17157_t:CDS:2 [Acaulospora morrowiae]
MDNLTVLTEGSKVYSEKRKRKKERPTEVIFDETARREFLTGFHKRKLERKEKAREAAILREKKARAETRKAAKEAKKKEIEEKLKAFQSLIDHTNISENDYDSVDEVDDDSDNDSSRQKLSEYKAPQTLTTVTIIEDFDVSEAMNHDGGDPKRIKLEVKESDGRDEKTGMDAKNSTKNSNSTNIKNRDKRKDVKKKKSKIRHGRKTKSSSSLRSKRNRK